MAQFEKNEDNNYHTENGIEMAKHFGTEDIMDKERTLRSMLKPNTWNEIVNMLKYAGFNDVQSFWQNHTFVGAMAIKN